MYNENMLSAVLSKNYVRGVTVFTAEAFMNQSVFNYSTKSYKFTGHNVDIHNLAHQCKVWAFEQGFEIVSHCTYVEVVDLSSLETLIRFTNTSNDEAFIAFDPHFDIKACEFVFETIADRSL